MYAICLALLNSLCPKSFLQTGLLSLYLKTTWVALWKLTLPRTSRSLSRISEVIDGALQDLWEPRVLVISISFFLGTQ